MLPPLLLVAYIGTCALISTSCTSTPDPVGDPKHRVSLLWFEGCPTTTIVRTNLQEALGDETLRDRVDVVEVDLRRLPANDPRLGWGSPTILFDNEDLFGQSPSSSRSISCRIWEPVPDEEVIHSAMLEHLAGDDQ